MTWAMLILTVVNACIPPLARGQTVKAACIRLLSRLLGLLLLAYWIYSLVQIIIR